MSKLLQKSSQEQTQNLSTNGQGLLTLSFIMWQNGKHSKALAILEGLRHLEPHSHDYLPLLCAVYLENQLFEQALEVGSFLMKHTTGQAYRCAAHLCATSLWKSGKKAEAQSLIRQALEVGDARENS